MKEIARGHHGVVYDVGDGTILKQFSLEEHPLSVQAEAQVANLAHQHGVPTPMALHCTIQETQLSIQFEKISGPTLAREVLSKPWKLIWATRSMARIFAQIHSLQVSGLPEFKTILEHKISHVPKLSETQRERALAILADLEDGSYLCHRDYHPGNLLIGSKNQCYVIDWGAACVGAPIADITHAYILNKVDGVLEDVPWFNRLLIKFLRNLYIELFLFFYVRNSDQFTYRELKRGIRRWLVPVAAARLASYGDFETAALLKFLKNAGE